MGLWRSDPRSLLPAAPDQGPKKDPRSFPGHQVLTYMCQPQVFLYITYFTLRGFSWGGLGIWSRCFLVFQACPTGWRLWGTHWRDYVFQLAWKCLWKMDRWMEGSAEILMHSLLEELIILMLSCLVRLKTAYTDHNLCKNLHCCWQRPLGMFAEICISFLSVSSYFWSFFYLCSRALVPWQT